MSITLSNERYEEIKRTVVDMYIKYHINSIPVNGFAITSKMGVTVIPYSAIPKIKRYLLLKKSEDGFSVEKNKGEWYIYYNDVKDYGRINNTIMHEVGHIILDHSEDSELAEKEVKFFAKYALTPPVLIHKLNLDCPEAISDIFEISYQAALYAFSYYKKWCHFGSPSYTDYEVKLLYLFKEAV